MRLLLYFVVIVDCGLSLLMQSCAKVPTTAPPHALEDAAMASRRASGAMEASDRTINTEDAAVKPAGIGRQTEEAVRTH